MDKISIRVRDVGKILKLAYKANYFSCSVIHIRIGYCRKNNSLLYAVSLDNFIDESAVNIATFRAFLLQFAIVDKCSRL